MKNIELRRKVIGPEGYLVINTIIVPKNAWSFRKLKNEMELFSNWALAPRRAMTFAFAIIAIVLLTIIYSAWSNTNNSIDNQTWTNVDLSSSRHEYNSDVQ
jgi:hypothetical protein